MSDHWEDLWVTIPLKHVSFLHAMLKTQAYFSWSLVCLHTSSHKHSSCENQQCLQGLQTLNIHISCAVSQLSTLGLQIQPALSGLPGLRYGHMRNTGLCKCMSCLLHWGSFKIFQSTKRRSQQKRSGQPIIFSDILTFAWHDILHGARLIVYTILSMHSTTQCKTMLSGCAPFLLADTLLQD